MPSPTRLLVADDSTVFVEAFRERLEAEHQIRVVGVARDGLQALDLAKSLRPDVITLDIHMPAMNGLEAVQRIMSSVPTPILILTADPNSQDSGWCFEALSRGALELSPKPDLEELWAQPGKLLCERIRLLASIRVVHHARPTKVQPSLAPAVPRHPSPSAGSVVIGASTGGPAVLAQILGQLGRNFPLPIVIVQHLAQGFVQHLAGWLGDCSELTVKAASDGCRLLPGTVLLAPDDRHVSFDSRERVTLGSEPEQCHYRPSADVLFRSAADCFGSDAIGVILSGMGRDGAEGLKVLREAGALTIAQSAESCAVDGMPKAARDIGAATCALSPLLIGPRIIDSARRIVLNARTRPGK